MDKEGFLKCFKKEKLNRNSAEIKQLQNVKENETTEINRKTKFFNIKIFRNTKKLFSRKKIRNKSNENDTEDSFIIHGIDYLPEKMKKKEKNRKIFPKFLEFPPILLRSQNENRPVFPINFFKISSNSNIGKITNNQSSLKKHNIEEKNMVNFNDTNNNFINIPNDDWKNFKNYPFQNIVMSGGGSKGYAFIGALKALEDCGVLKEVKKLAGSSAGAICAGLFAVGCSPQEIADVFKCDIKWLFHDQKCVCCCLPGMYSEYGVHPAKRFHKIYGQHLRKKSGSADITFKQLYDKRGVELCVVVTNLSRMRSEYCNHFTCPNLPIRDAVRMSMSFPVMYRAVRATISGRESLYTDGGLLDQFPITYFDDGGLFARKKVSNLDDEDEDEEEDVVKLKEALEKESKSQINFETQLLLDNESTKLETKNLDDLKNIECVGDDFEDCEDKCSNNNAESPDFRTLGLYVVSERALDHKIWKALFGCRIPYRPTYLPNTKLARLRLKHEIAIRKMHDKQFNKQEFMEALAVTADLKQHYELMHKSHVDIKSLSDYFMTALEALLISQRKVRVHREDRLRTVAINCGYIGTNDYEVEPADREFMIDQGYSCTVKYLEEFLQLSSTKPASTQ